MAENIEKDIRNLLAEILECSPEEIGFDAHFVKDLGMDSMMALEVLAGIEKMYRIVIPEEELKEFTSLAKTVNVVGKILKKNG